MAMGSADKSNVVEYTLQNVKKRINEMKKMIFFYILFGFFSISVGTELCFSSDYNNPCTSPIATCITKSDGSRWCGLPQQTMVLCSQKIKTPKKKQPSRIDRYRPPSCRKQCEASYENCRDRVNEERARKGAGRFTALNDAAKYTKCKVTRRTCYKRCK